MPRELETGENKIQQICDLLKVETLEPAKKEAARIIEEAKQKAKQIVEEAEKEAGEIHRKAQSQIEKEREVFRTSLKQGAMQCFESLKQKIQFKLFNKELEALIEQGGSSPDVVAKLIDAMIKAIEREGSSASLSALIPHSVSVDDANRLLGEQVLKRLEGESVKLGSFAAGAQIKLQDKQLTLDISDTVLKELLGNYLRKDFRELLFQS